MVWEERVELRCRYRPAEPAEAREEDELQLARDRAGDAQKEVVEAAVVEVVVDPGAADPPDPAVDDQVLAVVDVPELFNRPAGGIAGGGGLWGRAQLHRAHHAHLDAACQEPRVEVAALAVGVGAARVDDDAERDARGGLGEQHACELVADHARPEAELVDVHRRRRALDVAQHRRGELAAGDVDVRGRCR